MSDIILLYKKITSLRSEVFRTHSYILASLSFLCPLVSMLNHIKNKGVITDHVKKELWKNLENPLIYSVFHLQGEQMKFFENIFFFYFKPLYLGQI